MGVGNLRGDLDAAVAIAEQAIDGAGRVALPAWPFLDTLPGTLASGGDRTAAFRQALADGAANLTQRFQDDEPVEALLALAVDADDLPQLAGRVAALPLCGIRHASDQIKPFQPGAHAFRPHRFEGRRHIFRPEIFV